MAKKEITILTPDRLDQLHTVIDPAGWLGLLFLLSVIVIATVWLFVGKIPTSISGTGILINAQGLETVVVNASGRLTRFDIQTGQKIVKGQVVAEVAQIELSNKIDALERKIQEKKHSNKEKDNARVLLEKKYFERITSLKNRLNAQENLVKKGVVIEENALKTKDEIIQAENQYQSLKITKLDEENELHELERQLKTMKSDYEYNSITHSPFSGTVVEVKESVGNVIQPGEALLTLELSDEREDALEAVIYISALEGEKIKNKMEVKIVPTFIKPQEYGSLIGEVIFVSSYPATYDSMMRVFQNDIIVKDIIKTGSQVEVRARLLQDKTTPSGFKWTSKIGPALRIQSGILCNAKIKTREKTPIELIIPEFKRMLGVDS